MKNALICLEQLNVGGVETFSVTQIEEFSKRGINCVVLAKKGKLCEKIEKIKNVKIIDFEYKLQNYIDFDKVKVIENVIIENNIANTHGTTIEVTIISFIPVSNFAI